MYSYVIEVADSESDLGLFSTTLVSEILLFLRIRDTYIFQFNDLFALLFEEIHDLNFNLLNNTLLKVNTLHTPSMKKTLLVLGFCKPVPKILHKMHKEQLVFRDIK